MSAALSQDDDLYELTRLLDIAKTSVFRGEHAAFMGSLMCSLNFMWTTSLPTAATNGVSIMFNPEYFTKLPPASRITELLHELRHVALMHIVRLGSRNAHVFNLACDIKIDLDLLELGCTFEGISGVLTFSWLDCSKYVGWVEEDIYDDLMLNHPECQGSGGMPPPGRLDMLPHDSPDQMAAAVNSVIRAVHQAKMSGAAGTIPGDIETIISNFMKPIIPWQKYVHDWMTDQLEDRYTMQRPNRRYEDMYMPSWQEDEGRLKHLVYIEDVSGSITDSQAHRFNSEFSYVKKKYNPKKMTLVQFDTRITQVIEYGEYDSFEQVKIIGRGGTDLACVKAYLDQNDFTAAVIFSDLQCSAMDKLKKQIPILWVCIQNRDATVPYGKIIHIGA